MDKILDVSSVKYIDKKKFKTKLFFTQGQKFYAKLCGVDKETGEITLKLANGSEFKAEVLENLERMEGDILRFTVEGLSDGKLKLKLSEIVEKEEEINPFENILAELGLEDNEENVELLSKMLKHNITLTKDNIAEMKNILNLKEKIQVEEEEFLKLILDKSDIDLQSDKGEISYKILKDCFKDLRTCDLDSIMFFKENNLELNKENIEGIKYIIENDNVLSNELEKIILHFEDILDSSRGVDFKEIDSKTINLKQELNLGDLDNIQLINTGANAENKENNIELKHSNMQRANVEDASILDLNKKYIGDNTEIKENNTSNDKVLLEGEGHIEFLKEKSISSLEEKNLNTKNNIDILKGYLKAVGDKTLYEYVEKKINLLAKDTENNIVDASNENLSDDIKALISLGKNLKEDISKNIDIIKTNIKSIIKLTESNLIFQDKTNLEHVKIPINNLKILNSIYNEYYYLDFPLKVIENEYPFKLIIKNKNNQNKTIYPKDIKIVASIKTLNMGPIDNYITIKDNHLDLKIKVNNSFKNVLNKFKYRLVNSLNDMGYKSNIVIQEIEKEISLTNSCEFFEDPSFSSINTLI
ncbi:hypothetical protein ACOAKC_11520 [Hathewaya histolytica]|uniref:hypothetical protein n=1 Tax=Hathewaya histolytica TaxID=1498 RepID=UPI003B678E85